MYFRDTFIHHTTPTPQEATITSASVNNLYWNCGNTIQINVSDQTKSIQVKASSTSVIQSRSDLKRFSIIPNGKTCVLSITTTDMDGTTFKWDRKFNVIKPPKPTIQLLVNGKEYNGVSPVPKKSRVVVRLKPDADFRAKFPKDARYMISNVDLLSQRSLGAPSKVGAFSGSGKDAIQGIPISLGNKLRADPPGTKVYFKIAKVYRVNFQNKKVEEKYSDRELYVGLVVK